MPYLLGTRLDDDLIILDALLLVEREADVFRFVGRCTTRRDEHERMEAFLLTLVNDGALALLENTLLERAFDYFHAGRCHFTLEEVVVELRSKHAVEFAECLKTYFTAFAPQSHEDRVLAFVNFLVQSIYFRFRFFACLVC